MEGVVLHTSCWSSWNEISYVLCAVGYNICKVQAVVTMVHVGMYVL